MIEWMQKHKKWLVITIWVSTIAFVGAGFVGWGSYQFGKTNSTIMSVGDEDIELSEVQDEYSKLFNQYKQIFGTQFNKEMADQIKLDKIALNNVMQRYFLLNLSKEYRFYATDEEVAKEIVSNKAFYTSGKFDKDLYKKILKENRIDINKFEDGIKKDIMIKKLVRLFDMETLPSELDSIKKYIFAKDKIAYKIIDLDNIKINIDDKKLKDYYEKNKNRYKSNEKFLCSIKRVDGEKKEALRRYLDLKKGKIDFKENVYLDKLSKELNSEDIEKIKKVSLKKVLKPIKTKEGFVIIRLDKIEQPKVLPFESVKVLVKEELKKELKMEKANKIKDSFIKNFKSNKIALLDREKPAKVDNLNDNEINKLTSSVSNSLVKIDSVNLGNKIVVFKLIDTIISNPTISKVEVSLNNNIKQIKQDEIFTNLLDKLSKKIEVVEYYK